jgi:hypothetical protein
MTQITWDELGERKYQAGVDRGVLYPVGSTGVPWNGIVGVNEAPSGGEPMAYYYDGVKYRIENASEEYAATLEAYTYPDEFEACDGSLNFNGLVFTQQERQPFHFSYRTKVGNDVDGILHGYKIHLVFNAMVSPTSRANVAMNATPDPMNFSWGIQTRPIFGDGIKPTAHLVIDSRHTNPRLLAEVERILYGSETSAPRMPTGTELISLYAGALEIVFNSVTGLNALKAFEDYFDLMGNQEVGVFSIPENSRLVETATPGIYRMDI